MAGIYWQQSSTALVLQYKHKPNNLAVISHRIEQATDSQAIRRLSEAGYQKPPLDWRRKDRLNRCGIVELEEKPNTSER